MIRLISDIPQLEEIEPIWENIFQKDPMVTPFQKYGYIRASVDYQQELHPQLSILLVKDDMSSQWVAIFPFVVYPKGELRFINADHTDFCAPLILPEYNHYNLYEEVAQYIIHNKDIISLLLDNITANDMLLSAFIPHFKYNICVASDYYSLIPVYRLATDRDAVDGFRFVKKVRRNKLRKIRQKYPEAVFKFFAKKDGDNYPADIIKKLVEQMINNGIRTRAYFSQSMLEFWENLYNSNILSVAVLYDKGCPLVCNFVLKDENNNQYIKWILLYNDSHLNMVLNMFIEEVIYNGNGGIINFARGIYDYKLVNFHPDVKPLFRLYLSKTKKRYVKYFAIMSFHFLLRLISREDAGKLLRGISKTRRIFKR